MVSSLRWRIREIRLIAAIAVLSWKINSFLTARREWRIEFHRVEALVGSLKGSTPAEYLPSTAMLRAMYNCFVATNDLAAGLIERHRANFEMYMNFCEKQQHATKRAW